MEENSKAPAPQENTIQKTEKPYYDVDLRLVLFENEKREGKKDADYTGMIEVDKDLICRVAFWKTQGQKNIYLNGYLQNFADADIKEFKTTLKIVIAQSSNGKAPNIVGTIILNDGWEYNVVMWKNPARDDKKMFYSGYINLEGATKSYIKGGVI